MILKLLWSKSQVMDAVAAQRNSELEKAADANHTMVYPNRREHATTQSGRNFAVSAMLCRRKDATVYFVRTLHRKGSCLLKPNKSVYSANFVCVCCNDLVIPKHVP